MVELAKPGNLWFPVLLAAAYWAWVNWRECVIGGAMLAGVVGATDALGTQLKGLVQRPRPCVTLTDVHQLLGCGGAFSFPSNHAANTASAAAFFHSPLSTIGLDRLALGGGDRSFARVHRGALSYGRRRRLDRGGTDRCECGVVSAPLVSLPADCRRRSLPRRPKPARSPDQLIAPGRRVGRLDSVPGRRLVRSTPRHGPVRQAA